MSNEIIRHGDMCLEQIESLPEGLRLSDSETLMTGSGGNDHTYCNGEFYPKQGDQFIFGYFRSCPGCKLFHVDHGERDTSTGNFLKEIKNGKEVMVTNIPENMVFALRKQCEDTHDGMKPVVD